MPTDFSSQYLNLIEEVAEDGELTHKEIYQLAKWLNENKAGRKTWPANQFFPLLKSVFADGKIDKSEAQAVGQLIQKVRREWAREHSLSDATPGKSAIADTVVSFDGRKPRLPLISTSLNVASFSEPDLIYEIDFSGPSCSCPDFKSYRQHLPYGHISRCCKHIMQGYSELRPKDGWPSWLDPFLEAGFRPNPRQDWMVVKCGKSNFLLSSANSGWANAYSKINNENAKFGYNVSEDRWSYGREPDGAEILANDIRQMSDG